MDLAALEEIRQVKYRYLRCVDLKLWDEIADTFAADATASYGTPALGGKPIDLAGRDDDRRVPARTSSARRSSPCTSPASPRSSWTATRPRGTWSFEDTVIATEYRVVIKGAAFYEDRYARGATTAGGGSRTPATCAPTRR